MYIPADGYGGMHFWLNRGRRFVKHIKNSDGVYEEDGQQKRRRRRNRKKNAAEAQEVVEEFGRPAPKFHAPRLLLSDDELERWPICAAPGCSHLRGRKYNQDKFVGYYSHCCKDCFTGRSRRHNGHTKDCLYDDGWCYHDHVQHMKWKDPSYDPDDSDGDDYDSDGLFPF